MEFLEKEKLLVKKDNKSIYLGRDKVSSNPVVIEEYKKPSTKTEKIKLKLNIKTTKNMLNRYYLDIYHYVETRRHYIAVYEYINKGSLFDVMKNHQILNFPEKQAVFYLSNLIEIFYHLRIRKQYQRYLDLKNLFIDEGSGKLKINTIGIYKAFKVNKGANLINIPFEYIVAKMDNQKVKQSNNMDLWLLGIIFFRLLVGQTPFIGNTPRILHEDIMEKMISKSHFKFNISKNAKNLLEGLLQINPKKRISWTDLLSHSIFEDNGVFLSERADEFLSDCQTYTSKKSNILEFIKLEPMNMISQCNLLIYKIRLLFSLYEINTKNVLGLYYLQFLTLVDFKIEIFKNFIYRFIFGKENIKFIHNKLTFISNKIRILLEKAKINHIWIYSKDRNLTTKVEMLDLKLNSWILKIKTYYDKNPHKIKFDEVNIFKDVVGFFNDQGTILNRINRYQGDRRIKLQFFD